MCPERFLLVFLAAVVTRRVTLGMNHVLNLAIDLVPLSNSLQPYSTRPCWSMMSITVWQMVVDVANEQDNAKFI